MSNLYTKYMKLERENGLLKNEVKLMQKSLYKAYIRIKELIEEKNDRNNNSFNALYFINYGMADTSSSKYTIY